MSAYNFNPPKKCDVSIERQLEIAIVNAHMEDNDDTPRDRTRFDSFTVVDVDGVFEFKCSRDNSVYTVIPTEFIKDKLINRIRDNIHNYAPSFLAESLRLPIANVLTLRDATIMFEGFQAANVNLMITITTYTLFNSC